MVSVRWLLGLVGKTQTTGENQRACYEIPNVVPRLG
jgi:hypothetical protein